jgi:hypothetical protein
MVVHFGVEQESGFLVLRLLSAKWAMNEGNSSYLERRHGRSQIAFGNTWEFLLGSPLERLASEDAIPYLDTTFDHETFESLDTSIDQRTQLILSGQGQSVDRL